MSGDSEEPQRWYTLVRVTGLKNGIGSMKVVDAFPTQREVMKAFLAEPNKHALAIIPGSFYLRFSPGEVLPFEPGKYTGPTWVENLDRALDQALGRPCFTKPLTMAEQAREAGRDEPSKKVVDLEQYRQRKLGLDLGL